MQSEYFSPSLAVALTAYTVGIVSPGPSNMAIMATAMSQGRRQALALAAGVACGSLTWGFAAALGLSALMSTYSWVLVALKVLGGLYMLFLSWKSARAALSPHVPDMDVRMSRSTNWSAFASGLGMHLTNPKAIFVWASIVVIALPPSARPKHAFGVVAPCAIIGASVFFGYAFLFSTAAARAAYSKGRRWFNATLSVVFAAAGFRLLLSRSAP